MKCVQLHNPDEQGWSALHYATREYCTDVLSASLKVEGGEWISGKHFHCTCIKPLKIKFIATLQGTQVQMYT